MCPCSSVSLHVTFLIYKMWRKKLAQGHKSSMWQCQHLTAGSLTLEPMHVLVRPIGVICCFIQSFDKYLEPLIGARRRFRSQGYSNDQELVSSSSERWNKPRETSLSSTGRCPKGNSPGTPVGQGSLWMGARSCLAL